MVAFASEFVYDTFSLIKPVSSSEEASRSGVKVIWVDSSAI